MENNIDAMIGKDGKIYIQIDPKVNLGAGRNANITKHAISQNDEGKHGFIPLVTIGDREFGAKILVTSRVKGSNSSSAKLNIEKAPAPAKPKQKPKATTKSSTPVPQPVAIQAKGGNMPF